MRLCVPIRASGFGTLAACMVFAALTFRAAEASSSSALDEATDLFNDTEFESALRVLTDHLAQPDLSTDELLRANVLAARCHMRLDEEQAAIQRLCEVLSRDPSWQPDPLVFSGKELRTCRVALSICPRPATATGDSPVSDLHDTPRWYERRRWRLGLGIGAAALGLLVWSAVGGDDDGASNDGSVPGFPQPPSSALSADF